MVLILILLLILLISGAIAFLYFYLIDTYDNWATDRIKLIGRPVLGFGNVYSLFALRQNLSQLLHWMYMQEFPNSNSSMVAFFFLRKPAVLLRQPKLIRRVLIAYKHHFSPFALPDESTDPLLNTSSLFVGCNSLQTWQFKVNFTTERMTEVFPGLRLLCRILVGLTRIAMERRVGPINSYREMETHFWLTGYSTYVMQRFGMGEKNLSSVIALDMEEVGDSLYNYTIDPRRLPQHVYTRYAPIIAKVLGKIKKDLSSILPKETDEMFRKAVMSYLNIYENPNSLHHDCFLNWIHIDQDENRSLLDVETIVRQLFAFHLEIYLVNAVIGSFALFHLAWNPKVQARLRREIRRMIKKPDGSRRGLCYKDLLRFPYLDAVINETMRMHPVIGAVERICRETLVLSGSDGQQVILHPNDLVFVSTRGLHQDCNLWESADQFNPDRFLSSDRRRLRLHNRPLVPYDGLHTSTASLFHWTSLRILLMTMVYRFEFTRSSKTPRFPRLSSKTFVTTVEGGLWVKMRNYTGNPLEKKKEKKAKKAK